MDLACFSLRLDMGRGCMFMRRSRDYEVYVYQFHVPCGLCKYVLCFLFQFFQTACVGDPKWNQLYVSCMSPHDVKNIPSVMATKSMSDCCFMAESRVMFVLASSPGSFCLVLKILVGSFIMC